MSALLGLVSHDEESALRRRIGAMTLAREVRRSTEVVAVTAVVPVPGAAARGGG
jgi:hypothetical protein